MEKLVTLNISGEFDKGFVVQAEVRQDGGTTKNQANLAIAGASGKLPAHPELLEQYRHWQSLYNNLEEFFPNRLKNKGGFTNASDKDEAFAACRKAAKLLAKTLNTWLQSPDFQPIVNLLLNHLQDSTSTRILLATENHWLRRLPWCEWNLLEHIPNAEIVLASPKFKQVKSSGNSGKKEKVKILVILGDNAGTDADEAVIQKLIPDAEICWLKEPQRRDLDAPLWEKQWDILFFAGHGKTESDGSIGKIQINSKDTLTIDEIKNHLKRAINNGLKLAIFNACDGLGIAYQLAEGEDLYLPQIIVMREILPIAIAPKFLQYFLEAYTHGLSLSTAIRDSRKRLQILESDVPCVSWLPVLCQNPAEIPLRWHDLVIPPNPYQGLSAFQEKDAALFFGRETFTNQLVKVVETKKLVAVIGASGSGKSSVVLAGLIPSLRQQGNWLIASLRPESTPFDNLAKALLSPVAQLETGKSEGVAEVNGDEINQLAIDLQEGNRTLSDVVRSIGSSRRFLLVIDQFEEIYTYHNQKSRQFLDCLLDAVQNFSSFRLVITLRVDFLNQAIEYNPFREQLDKWKPEFIGGMTRTELQAAIEEPAKKRNVYLEAGLTEHILNEVGEEQGNLPLLEFALTELWKQQENGLLTRLKYDEIGGVEKALCRHAEGVYDALKEGDKERTKQIFMKLVSPGEGTEYTRQLATRAEVGEENWDLVTHLATARLVVSNRNQTTEIETVEVVHEALIKAWPDLRKWIEENDTFLRWKKRLKVAFLEWERNENKEGYLLQGAPLGEAEGYLLQRLEDISKAERVFIQLGLGLRDRNRRRTILGLTSGLLAVSIFAVGAVWQWQLAERQRQRNFISELSTQAQLVQSEEESLIERSVLLAIESKRRGLKMGLLPLEADQALRQGMGLLLQPITHLTFKSNLQNKYHLPIFSPDSKYILTITDAIRLSEVSSGKNLVKINYQKEATYSTDGKYIAIWGESNVVQIWDLNSNKQLNEIVHNEKVTRVLFSPNSRYIAIFGEKNQKIWELNNKQKIIAVTFNFLNGFATAFSSDGKYITEQTQTNEQLWEIATGRKVLNTPEISSTQFSADAKYFMSQTSKSIIIWELPSGKEIIQIPENNLVNFWVVVNTALSPNGQYLALGTKLGDVELFEVSSGKKVLVINHSKTWVKFLNFSPDGKYLVVGGGNTDKFTRLIEIPNGKEIARVSRDVTDGLIFSSDGKYLAGYQVSVIDKKQELFTIWEMPRNSEVPLVHSNRELYSLAFSQDGKLLALSFEEGITQIRRVDNDREVVHLKHESFVHTIFSPDAKFLATIGNQKDGKQAKVRLWNVESGKQLAEIPIDSSDEYDTSIVFSPDGKYLNILKGNIVKVWNVITAQEIANIDYSKQLDGIVIKLKVSYDGRYLATIRSSTNEESYTLVIQELSSSKEVKRIKLEKDVIRLIRGLILSSDGKYVALFGGDHSASVPESWDGIIQVWQVSSGEKIKHIKLERLVSDVAFSPDSKFLAARVADDTTRVWDITRSKKEVTRIRYENRCLSWGDVAFSPDGKYLITIDKRCIPLDNNRAEIRGKKVQVWFWQPEDQIAEACRRLTRNLTLEEWQQYFPNESYRKTCPNLPIHTTSR